MPCSTRTAVFLGAPAAKLGSMWGLVRSLEGKGTYPLRGAVSACAASAFAFAASGGRLVMAEPRSVELFGTTAPGARGEFSSDHASLCEHDRSLLNLIYVQVRCENI